MADYGVTKKGQLVRYTIFGEKYFFNHFENYDEMLGYSIAYYERFMNIQAPIMGKKNKIFPDSYVSVFCIKNFKVS